MSGAGTERPTPRRLREARRRGEVGASRELAAAASLVAGLAALGLQAPRLSAELAGEVRAGLAAALSASAPAPAALRAALAALAGAAALPLLAALLAGLLAGGLQTRFLFAPALAAPRWDRVDLLAGLRRLGSVRRAADAALAAARAALSLGLGALLLARAAPALASLPRLGVGSLARGLVEVVGPAAWVLAGSLCVFGLLDLVLVRRRLARSLRMTREEVLRDQRAEEGEPRLKAERRRTHRALATAGPMAGAAVLVVNPVHLAVALAHRRGDEDPPLVLAKGSGPAAARLRAVARRLGVPLVRDVALARSLFRLAEVGEHIPEELYEAAAAVLVQVHGLGREALR